MKKKFSPSRFVIGTMMFGLRASVNQVKSIVSRANELGIVNYDTSPSYIDGEAQQLLSCALREACVDNALIHSKVGRSYDSNLPKNGSYLSRFHLGNALKLVFDCFSGFKIGNIKVHVYDDLDQLVQALDFLADLISVEDLFSGLGLCNLDNNTVNKVRSAFEVFHPDRSLTLQRRVAIGLEAEEVPIGIECWSYGMLNAGALVPASTLDSSSRYYSAKDRLDIRRRQCLIESSEVYRRARALCLQSDVHFADLAVAHPLLSGCSKVIIGPTHCNHLDVVERLLDEEYFAKVFELYRQLL